MTLVCANCGKKEGPDATYCRDCYTVFPFEVRASANRAPKRSATPAAWKWVPVVALIAGGFLLTRIDYGEAEKPEEAAADTNSAADPWAQRPETDEAARSRNLAAGKPRRIADEVRSDLGARNGAAPGTFGSKQPVPRISPAIRAANQYVGWVLKSDAELACPSGKPCPATIKFSSGERASYFVERWNGTSNTVIPANDKASRLLASHRQGVLEMKLPGGGTRSASLEKRSSRWAFGATDALGETNSEDIPAPQVREE